MFVIEKIFYYSLIFSGKARDGMVYLSCLNHLAGVGYITLFSKFLMIVTNKLECLSFHPKKRVRPRTERCSTPAPVGSSCTRKY